MAGVDLQCAGIDPAWTLRRGADPAQLRGWQDTALRPQFLRRQPGVEFDFCLLSCTDFLRRQLRRGGDHVSGVKLGMSYEIADARVADVRSQVWTLTHVTFTGAAILRRNKAAYRDTWIELYKSS